MAFGVALMEEDGWLGWHEVPGVIDGVTPVSQARGLPLTACASSEREAGTTRQSTGAGVAARAGPVCVLSYLPRTRSLTKLLLFYT